jgi:ankyrin repeat protein
MNCEMQCKAKITMNNNDSLINAIKSNDISLVSSLIDGGSVDVKARIDDMRNSTLLHLAAKLGHVEIVVCLLDAGARIDDVDDSDCSACHIATFHGHTDVVKQLIARNADVSLRNTSNETPVQIAIDKKNELLLMLLIDAAMTAGTPPDNTAMCLAATVGAGVIQLLLSKHRINLNAIRDNTWRTPLHRAVWRASGPTVLGMLIDVAGVDVNAREANYSTAVHAACMMRDYDALVRLVAAGANLELADNNDETPLHYSRFDRTEQCAIFLLAVGADVHAKNNVGRTACHLASKSAHPALPALIAFGANLDEPDNKGITPRQLLKTLPPTTEQVELARRRVHSVQLSLVRQRAFVVCVALQSVGFDALCLCEILIHSCGPFAPVVPFHLWWRLATLVKHHHK